MADSNNSEYPTILGADASFKGHLEFEKGVQLLGKFEGEISSSGQLLVADGAALNGDVRASNIRIDGNVKGNLDAQAKVQLTASARVEGDVQAARLEVAEGAVLVGRCVVGVNGKNGKPTADTKSASAPASSVERDAAARKNSGGQQPVVAGKR